MRALMRAAAFVFATLAPTLAIAQSPAEFYKGKTVELDIGYSVGGGYDLYARVLARHMGRHIPGEPTIVPKNMEGAGSLRLANWLAKVGPKDGTVFGTIGRGTAFDPLLGLQGAMYKATDFSWLGSANNEVSICASWNTSGITKFDDLRTQGLTIGGTGPSDDTVQFPKILNAVLDTKFKIVTGYPGGNDVVLAMERGEVQGRCGWSWSSVLSTHGSWVTDQKLNVLVQLALEKHPDLPDVPLVTDLATTDEQKQILTLIFARQVMGRPFLAPPGVPKERVEILRKAFMDTMQDPEFLADADKAKLEITPVSGEKVEALVKRVVDTPPAVAQRAAAALK
jgi:tripartite-type tricarboxylate transporter receptor subunit TctC